MNVSKIRIDIHSRFAHCATLWFFVNVASRDCNFKRRRWFYKFKMVASALRRMLLFCYCLILQQPWWLLWRKQCCLPFRAGMTTRSWDNHKTMTSAKFLGLLLIVGGIQFASAIRFVQQGKNLKFTIKNPLVSSTIMSKLINYLMLRYINGKSR